MKACEVCGNESEMSFEVELAGEHHVFDSFECAIHALARTCSIRGCKVVGHSVEGSGASYCCTRCARNADETAVDDRAGALVSIESNSTRRKTK